MTILQHRDRSIVYHLEPGIFSDDVALLQGSRAGTSFWRPVLDELAPAAHVDGRVLLCEWHASGKSLDELAADFVRTIQVLGLKKLRVVACDDAVEMIERALKQAPQAFGKTLLWAVGAPSTPPDIAMAIRAFGAS